MTAIQEELPLFDTPSFEALLETAQAQEEKTPYTTPSFRQYLRMKKNHALLSRRENSNS